MRARMSERSSLLRSAGSISVATAMSRVLGLLRDQLQAYFFGAGFSTDAFVAAFRIPNLLRDLFAEGALSAAFVPTFTATREREGDDAAWRLANRVITALCVLLGGLAVVLLVGARPILRLYTPGFGDDKLALAATMTRIMAPFLLFVALAALAMGVLNTMRVFFLPALSPAWFNLACIAGMLALPPLLRPLGFDPILALAIGAIAGGALQFLVQVPSLRRRGFRFRWEWAPSDPGLVRMARLMLPAVFGLAATQINIFVDTMLASNFGDGPMSWLNYAFRLIQLPIGLFGVALATANLTRVSRDSARGDMEGMRVNLAGALRAAALFTLPATAGLIALREPIIRILYEHGSRFHPADTHQAGAALLCYAVGLSAYAVTKIQVPTFYALGNTRVPVLSSAVAVTVKIGANFALIALFRRLGLSPFLALATTTSLAAWINFGILAWGTRRLLGSLRGLGVVPMVAKMAAVSTAMGFACAFAYGGLLAVLPGGTFVPQLVRLGAVVALGAALTGALALALGIPEAKAIAARVARRGGSA
jgi:putative peptidoglycan lipid II flippase